MKRLVILFPVLLTVLPVSVFSDGETLLVGLKHTEGDEDSYRTLVLEPDKEGFDFRFLPDLVFLHKNALYHAGVMRNRQPIPGIDGSMTVDRLWVLPFGEKPMAAAYEKDDVFDLEKIHVSIDFVGGGFVSVSTMSYEAGFEAGYERANVFDARHVVAIDDLRRPLPLPVVVKTKNALEFMREAFLQAFARIGDDNAAVEREDGMFDPLDSFSDLSWGLFHEEGSFRIVGLLNYEDRWRLARASVYPVPLPVPAALSVVPPPRFTVEDVRFIEPEASDYVDIPGKNLLLILFPGGMNVYRIRGNSVIFIRTLEIPPGERVVMIECVQTDELAGRL